VRRNPSLKEIVVGNRILASVANEILLSIRHFVLWKMGILCAFPGEGENFPAGTQGYALEIGASRG